MTMTMREKIEAAIELVEGCPPGRDPFADPDDTSPIDAVAHALEMIYRTLKYGDVEVSDESPPLTAARAARR